MTQPQLLDLFDEFAKNARLVIERKNKDYANSDALSNFKMSANIAGVKASVGCLNQIAIKVSRLGVLLNKDGVENEPISDTVLDLFNYSFLLQAILYDEANV